MHTSAGSIVEFLLIFSGLDANGDLMIFNYIEASIDPAVSTNYAYSFIYYDPEVISSLPAISWVTGDQLGSIIDGEGLSATHSLIITLLWNAEQDLDLTFDCDDGTTIEYSSPDSPNYCGASLGLDMMATDYNQERGDGSFGQLEVISIGMPTDQTTYTGTIINWSYRDPVQFLVVFSGLD